MAVRPLVVHTGRHPFEVAFLSAAVVVGLVLWLVDQRPQSVQSAMPVVVQALWVSGLVSGGLVGLGSLWLQARDVWRGLVVELFAMSVTGSALIMYAVAIFTVSGVRGLAGGGFTAAFGVAAWSRFAQIVVDLRRISRVAVTGSRSGGGDGDSG